ncbi:prophage tail fiber N-terminal domain-containing protein, partial [Escherichia coli]
MAVKISGVLKDGTGKPVQNCTIQLKAKRNSTTVVVNTLASENPDESTNNTGAHTHSVSGTAASAGAHTHSMTFVSGG